MTSYDFSLPLIFSVYLLVLCLWNGAFNKKTAKYVFIISISLSWTICPLSSRLFSQLFKSKLWAIMYINMLFVTIFSYIYLNIFKNSLFKCKKHILYISVLSATLMPILDFIVAVILIKFFVDAY